MMDFPGRSATARNWRSRPEGGRVTRVLPSLLIALAVCLAFALALSPSPALAQEDSMGAEAVVARLDAYCDQYAGNVPVSAIVVSNGTTVASYRYGGAGQAGGDEGEDEGEEGDGKGDGEEAGEGQAPDSEVVDWGRCSDLLIWASVMHLVETGQLRLDAAIRSNLPDGVTLPDGYSSLTMLDLMNHVTGLNVSVSSAAATGDGRSITSVLAHYKAYPAWSVGQYVSYSSYDVALAAAVVETVSGKDICSYVEDNILIPLGMDDTAVAAGLTVRQMAGSSDEHMSQLASQVVAKGGGTGQSLLTLSDLLAYLNSSDRSAVVSALDDAALTCVGSTDDLLTLMKTMVSPRVDDGVFSKQGTADELFTTTRTFPSLGTRRIAHGLFALPTRPSAVGMVSSTSQTTCAAYMDRDTRCAVLVVVGQAAHTGLAQGVAGAALGQSVPTADQVAAITGTDGLDGTDDTGGGDTALATMTTAMDWAGVYQDVSLATHGPTKILALLESTLILRGDDGYTIAGDLATSLGSGVYVTDEPAGDDPYRFHVGLVRGAEYSRTMTDAYRVPASYLVFEVVVFALTLLAAAMGVGYSVAGVVGVVRARIRRTRWGGQATCLWMAIATSLATAWTVIPLMGGQSAFLSAVPLVRVLNVAYIVLSAVGVLWLVVTRWRGARREPSSLWGAVLIALSSLTMCFALVFWEMLP